MWGDPHSMHARMFVLCTHIPAYVLLYCPDFTALTLISGRMGLDLDTFFSFPSRLGTGWGIMFFKVSSDNLTCFWVKSFTACSEPSPVCCVLPEITKCSLILRDWTSATGSPVFLISADTRVTPPGLPSTVSRDVSSSVINVASQVLDSRDSRSARNSLWRVSTRESLATRPDSLWSIDSKMSPMFAQSETVPGEFSSLHRLGDGVAVFDDFPITSDTSRLKKLSIIQSFYLLCLLLFW